MSLSCEHLRISSLGDTGLMRSSRFDNVLLLIFYSTVLILSINVMIFFTNRTKSTSVKIEQSEASYKILNKFSEPQQLIRQNTLHLF